MSMYCDNIFKESKDSDNITSILTCLNTNPQHSLKYAFKGW